MVSPARIESPEARSSSVLFFVGVLIGLESEPMSFHRAARGFPEEIPRFNEFQTMVRTTDVGVEEEHGWRVRVFR